MSLFRLPTLALILAAAALAPGAAAAQIVTLGRSGVWEIYGGRAEDGAALCGMMARGADRAIHLKYFSTGTGLVVQIYKEGWRIPRDAQVPMWLRIDSAPGWSVVAGPTRDGRGVEFRIRGEALDQFELLFRQGSRLYLGYLEGNEADWEASLQGSSRAVDLFAGCLRAVTGRSEPTQPFTPRRAPETQPYATQPWSPAPPSPAPPEAPAPSPALGEPGRARRT